MWRNKSSIITRRLKPMFNDKSKESMLPATEIFLNLPGPWTRNADDKYQF